MNFKKELSNLDLVLNEKRADGYSIDFPQKIIDEVLDFVISRTSLNFVELYLKSDDFLDRIDPIKQLIKLHPTVGKGIIFGAVYPFVYRSLAHFCMMQMLSGNLVLTDHPETEGIYDILVADGFVLKRPEIRPDFLLLKGRGRWTEIMGASVCTSIWEPELLPDSRTTEIQYYLSYGLRHDLLAEKDLEWLQRLGEMFSRTYDLPNRVSITDSKFSVTFWTPYEGFRPELREIETERVNFRGLPFSKGVPRLLAQRIVECYHSGPKPLEARTEALHNRN